MAHGGDELRARVQSLLNLQALRKPLEAERLTAEQAKRAALRVTFERDVAPSMVEHVLADGTESLMADAGTRRDAVALFAEYQILIDRLLAKAPGDRYQSAHDLLPGNM